MPTPTPSQLKKHATEIWQAGVAAVDAQKLVAEFVSVTPEHLCFGETKIAHADYERILVIGGGKASGWMAAGLELTLDAGLQTGFPASKQILGRINVPDDQVASAKMIEVVPCRPPGINLPTERVLASTASMIELAAHCQPDDLIICLISGGGSALLESPVASISLADFCAVTQLLSHGGASIEELNTVRREISWVKGGGLAELANCRRMVTLIVSDVIGDSLEVIASGPTLQASARADQALSILKRFDPQFTSTPRKVLEFLQRSATGTAPRFWEVEAPAETNGEVEAPAETNGEVKAPKIQTAVTHFIIGNIQLAVAAARAKAIELGYQCETETDASNETAEQSAERLVTQTLFSATANCNLQGDSKVESKVESKVDYASVRKPSCFISGGEPTVKLCENPGRGGRNQQWVLAAMQKLLLNPPDSSRDYCYLSAGTDGEDGNVPVAGALFDFNDIQHILANDETALVTAHLQSNDGYPLLDQWNCLLQTPPTRTNVCDLRIALRT